MTITAVGLTTYGGPDVLHFDLPEPHASRGEVRPIRTSMGHAGLNGACDEAMLYESSLNAVRIDSFGDLVRRV